MKKIKISLMGLLLMAASGLAGCEYYAADQIRDVQAAPVQKAEKPAEETKVEGGDAVIVPQESDDSWRIEKEALEKRIVDLAKAVEDAKTPVQPVTPPPPLSSPAPSTPPPASSVPPSTPPPVSLFRKIKDIVPAPKVAPSVPIAVPAKKLDLDGSDRTDFWTSGGGDGGERFRTFCGFGEVVVGYKLKSGNFIDRMETLVCKSLDRVANGTIGDFVEVPIEGGGGSGGELDLVLAPEGEAMVGWNAKANKYEPDDDGDAFTVIVEFQPLSARILREIGIINESREGEAFGLGENSVEWTHNRCPNGYVLKGIEGLAGNYVDNLKGLCTRVVVK